MKIENRKTLPLRNAVPAAKLRRWPDLPMKITYTPHSGKSLRGMWRRMLGCWIRPSNSTLFLNALYFWVVPVLDIMSLGRLAPVAGVSRACRGLCQCPQAWRAGGGIPCTIYTWFGPKSGSFWPKSWPRSADLIYYLIFSIYFNIIKCRVWLHSAARRKLSADPSEPESLFNIVNIFQYSSVN